MSPHRVKDSAEGPTAEIRIDPFVLVDFGHSTHVLDCDVLYDLPGVITIARFIFRNGVGYEVTFSTEADVDDLTAIDTYVPHGSVRVSSGYLAEPQNGHKTLRVQYWQG